MTIAVATIEHRRGESFSWALRSDPAYDGSEVVTSDVKVAADGKTVPPEVTAATLTLTPAFVAASGDVAAHWLFSVTAAQSAALVSAAYVTDARVLYVDGSVDYPLPLRILMSDRVTVPAV